LFAAGDRLDQPLLPACSDASQRHADDWLCWSFPSGELGGAAEGTVVNPDLAIVAGDNGPDDGKSEPLDGALDYESHFQDGAGTVIAFVPVSDVAVEPRCPPPTLRSWCTTGRSTTSTRPTVRWAPT
jgi:hypothetical protein